MRHILHTLALTAALLPGASVACTVLSPFSVNSLSMADIILVGEVTGFKMIHQGPSAALVTVRVTDVLKGTAAADMVLIWNDGMAMGPFAPRAQGIMVVGAMAPGRATDPAVPDFRPDLPMIVQPYCGDVWMQPATPALLAEVKALVAR